MKALIDQYADLESISPSVYTAATKALDAALDKFNKAEKDLNTGIEQTDLDASGSHATEIYSLSGVRLNQLQPNAVNIIRTADGKVRKVIVR